MSAVRRKIEEILGKGERRRLLVGYLDARKKGYRLKLVTKEPASPEEKEKILGLPHVTKVGFTDTMGHWGYSGGVTIYFDCNPKDIEV